MSPRPEDDAIRRALHAAHLTADFRVVLEMSPDGQSLNIRTKLPPPLALAMVQSAYNELISLKVRTDMQAPERRIIDPGENGAPPS